MSTFKVVVADPPYGFSDKLEMSEIKRGSEANYDTLSIEDLKDLEVKDICDENSILALWCPSSLLSEGLDIMKAWGFRQTQTHIWVKTKKLENLVEALKEKKRDSFVQTLREAFAKAFQKEKKKEKITKTFQDTPDLANVLAFGMGRLFRQTHEIVLVGVRGKIYNDLKNKSQRSVHFYPATKHSQKPEELQDMLDVMFPPPEDGSINRVELFARRERPYWVCLGNELEKSKNEDIRLSLKKLLKLKEISSLNTNSFTYIYDDQRVFNMWGDIPVE